MKTLGVVLFLVLGVAALAAAGLPGYFEWILWKSSWAEGAAESAEDELEWVSGPYPKLLDCEKERDRLAEVTARTWPAAARHLAPGSVVMSGPSGRVRVRFLCVPDSVNPRQDRRWR